ncbi:hypothetical protein [Brevibacterium sp.]|uniref:hypothetical protein n=1 Tax=Brevibacterium sp. TaxID=1701 RepID=UPI002812257B|nr:hypothetical protein [Brevibacterium sp.]
MALKPKWMIAFAVPLALGLAACSTTPSNSEESTPAETTAESAKPGPAAQGAETGTTDAEEPGTGDASAEATMIEVEPEGNGPIGLKSKTDPGVESAPVSGKLITGPGGCFSFVDSDQPRLLVFGDDAEFVLREDKPSVTSEAVGTVEVGSQFSASAASVGLSETTGIPERCTHGAQDQVLIVTGK